ncbi:MAG: hypothetical protein KDC05_15855, partial [Bacteroidales bacterium]|nr:hypothetical protein [Bacteroidales bacterium]
MKKILLIVCAAIVWTTSQAQWQPVPVSGSSADVSSMFCFGDDLMVGTLGDGIHKTTDNGDTWENVTGNMGNLFVNDIRGGGAPTVIWAATQGGAFYTTDHQNYQNCSNGLTQNDVRHFFFGDASSQNAEWMIGTNGGGVFLSAELTGPWSPSNTGLSGDALIINDGAGYTDDELHYAVIGTDGGV